MMSDAREDAFLETMFRLPKRNNDADYTDPKCECCGVQLPEHHDHEFCDSCDEENAQ